MDQGAGTAAVPRSSKLSSHDKKFLAIALAILAVLSPLYVDRKPVPEPELDEEPIYFYSYLPLLQLVLVTAIAISAYLERGFNRLDPYWIHRVGGSSTGIVVVLIILGMVLMCKATEVHGFDFCFKHSQVK